jgi:hypothetical protein
VPDAARELEGPTGSEVKEVTLKALYMNADADSQTFKCSSVMELSTLVVSIASAITEFGESEWHLTYWHERNGTQASLSARHAESL